MTIAAAQHAARAQGLDRLDAQLLLLHALGHSLADSNAGRAWLMAHDSDALPAQAQRVFATCCQRRARGEPLAYILGQKEFHGLTLLVTPDVLVPRPDTEALVDWALDLFPGPTGPVPAQDSGETFCALDLGTGSGAIALALKHARPRWHLTGTDASPAALAVAQANAERLQLAVHWLLGDWFSALEGKATPGTAAADAAFSVAACGRPDWSKCQKYDLIASNPPYIEAADPHLASLRHEPIRALESGPDGLQDIRRIVRHAPRHLKPGAWLLLEHGHTQAPAVRALMQSTGLTQVQSRLDLSGIERCTGGQWLGRA